MIPENMLLLPKAQPHRTAQTDPVRNTVTEHTSMGTNISSVFRKRHRRRNRQRRRKRVWIANRRKHPSWNLLRMNYRRRQRIKSSPMQDGRRNGLHKKAEQAQNRLPARKKLRMETVSDPETGKPKKHLKFEKEVKSQKVHVKGPVPLRPVKAGAILPLVTLIKRFMRQRMKMWASRQPTALNLWARQGFARHITGIKLPLPKGSEITAKISKSKRKTCLPAGS